jgi:putative membrane protein
MSVVSIRVLIPALLPLVATRAVAHAVDAATGTPASDFWPAAVPISVVVALYAVGAVRLLRRVLSRGPHLRRAILFALGAAALWIALLTPLDTLGSELFSVHMMQHEALMLIAAPLLVLGHPLPVFLWAFPARVRQLISIGIRHRAVAQGWQALTRPMTAWTLHAAAVWLWHAPALFDAALANRSVHDVQHLSFLLTALLFWSAVLRSRQAAGGAVLYLFTTTMHTSVLGALLTFASQPLYDSYLTTAPHWNLTALEDQQLGGLIMWVPGSLVYVSLALVLLARWLSTPGADLRLPIERADARAH